MTEQAAKENRALIGFWDRAFGMSEEEREEEKARGPEGWRELAPSEKLLRAAESLGARKKVLDYGCGNAWAAVAAARSGCPDVIAADAAPGAVRAARFYAELYGVSDRVRTVCAGPDWLAGVPAGTFDGLICSNVLDVVPPETARDILLGAAKAVTEDALVIVGLNYYLSPEAAAERGMSLAEGRLLYIDGVLRLVSRTDGEWEEIFSPWFAVEELDYFAWPGETAERRRLFRLRRRGRNGRNAGREPT